MNIKEQLEIQRMYSSNGFSKAKAHKPASKPAKAPKPATKEAE